MNQKLIPWALALVLLATAGVFYYLYNEAVRAERIATSNERAALDTTRISLVGDLAAATHLVEQKEIKVKDLQGALSTALKDREANAIALQALAVAFDSLNRVDQKPSASVVDSLTGEQTLTFVQPGPPIQGRQLVRMDTTGRVTLETHLIVTPFSIRYALGCDKKHTPVAAFETPEWVTVGFEKGQIDPDVCNPPAKPFVLKLFSPDLGKLLYAVGGWVAKGLLSK